MQQELSEYIAMMQRLERVYGTLPLKAATIAVNFSKERFRKQNWVGVRTESWKKRKHDDAKSRGRAILVKKAKLKRDVHKILATHERAIVGTSTITQAYAQIHNEGGTVNTTATVGEHTRKQHTRKRSGRNETVKQTTIKSHQRKVKFRMPRRQFLGASPVMDNQIERMITAEFIKAVRKSNV